jgi:hypothetical protein
MRLFDQHGRRGRWQGQREGKPMHRTLFLVAIVGLFAALLVPPAFAGGTTHGTFTDTNQTYNDPAGDICPFAITITYNATGDYTDFYDDSGRFVGENDHIHAQNNYSANGKTLVGDWFTFEQIYKVAYDSGGHRYQTSVAGTGQAEKVVLPDGSLFYSAGRIDYLSSAFIDHHWIIVVNSGLSGNIAGFCAALAP